MSGKDQAWFDRFNCYSLTRARSAQPFHLHISCYRGINFHYLVPVREANIKDIKPVKPAYGLAVLESVTELHS